MHARSHEFWAALGRVRPNEAPVWLRFPPKAHIYRRPRLNLPGPCTPSVVRHVSVQTWQWPWSAWWRGWRRRWRARAAVQRRDSASVQGGVNRRLHAVGWTFLNAFVGWIYMREICFQMFMLYLRIPFLYLYLYK